MRRDPEQSNKRKEREQEDEDAAEEEAGPSVRRKTEGAQALRIANQTRTNDGEVADLT